VLSLGVVDLVAVFAPLLCLVVCEADRLLIETLPGSQELRFRV
jgi:hypothetical protein